MANFEPVSRNSYFKVRDNEEFKKLINKILPDAAVWEDKVGRVAFGGHEDITQYYDADIDDKVDIKDVIAPLLCEGEACIITLIGYEKLRYLVASCLVITKDTAKWIDAQEIAISTARKILNVNTKIKKNFEMTY